MKTKRILFLLMVMFTISFAYGQEADDKLGKAEALCKEGIALHDQGKFEEAIKKYDEGLKLLPYNATLIYEKAYSLEAMGKRAEAKKLLGKLYKKGNTGEDVSLPYMAYANILDDDGEAMKALEVYDKALEYVSPSDVSTTQLINYNKALTLYNLKDEDKAKIEDCEQQIFHHLENSIECNPVHAGSYLIFGRHLADLGAYYNAIAYLGITALLAGERIGALEAALNEWENKELDSDSGPLTTLSLNKVKEVLKAEPSEFGRLYDIFTTVIPAICSDTLGVPVPFSYAYDLVNDGIVPFFSELKRQGLLECFFHVAMKNAKVQYISNANWLTGHKSEEERLWNTIDELGVFKSDLKFGYVPDFVEFSTAEEARRHNIDAMAACKFFMTHTIDSKDIPDVRKYILAWSVASPDVHVNIGAQVMDWANTNADYLTAYLAGCSFYSLTSHQKEWNKGTFARGVNEVLKLYDSSKHVLGENENLEKLLELFISEGDGFKNFIEENYNK